ncbi:glycosyltransferase family 2 protein [Spirulina subsalsa]|uniref:glycosyltransferase family 2 protein n=1 Tax=Spirulina subsalsa TaxID=54311 RepID=UPI0002E01A6E|nr:glycosyltransferase family 2 protein [Spirulina subsalsa]
MSPTSSPLVSILIPAYRAKQTLGDTIQSLLTQTYPHWEAVIGSDDQVDYLDHLAQQGISDTRLKQADTGGYGTGEAPARNAALTLAQGEIIANLDADDAYQPNRLAELVPLALKFGVALDNTGVYNSQGQLYKRPFPDRTALSFATAEDILNPRVPFFPVFRRELAGSGWTRVPFAADVLFNLELLSRSEQVALHPQPLYRYYKRDNSITQSPKAFETAEQAYQAILSLLDRGELELTPTIRASAQAEFTANLRLNDLFRQYMQEGRCQNLEEFLDLTENGHAAWLQPELNALPRPKAQQS